MDTTDTWKIENNICRCCHAEGYFFNLSEPRPFCGETEVYADMIRDIFDIDMKPLSGPMCELTYTICMSCIFKLREAIQFKKQVQSCEDKFLDYYYTNKLEVIKKREVPKTIIKIEPVIEFKEEYLNEDVDSNDDTNPDFEIDDDDDDGDDDDDESKSDDDLEFLSKKGKGKGKGKPAPVVPKSEAATVKTEQKTPSKKLVKVERIKVPVKKKVAAFRRFFLEAKDYSKTGDFYKCSRCDTKIKSLTRLTGHVVRVHYATTAKSKYFCKLCEQGFVSRTQLTVHKYQKHNVDERYKCNACDGVFNSKITLSRHKNVFHMLGKKYKCKLCEYESYSFENLRKHKVSHNVAKNLECAFCKKSFRRRSNLKLHEKIHTGDKQQVCAECGEAFVQKASLNYHMAKYHPEVKY